jgi:outer membrane protein
MGRVSIGRRGIRLALAAGVAAGVGSMDRADAQERRAITLETAVEIALERNPTLRQAENAADMSSLTVRQQRMQLLPNLNLTSSTDRSYGRAFSQDEGRILNQTTNSFSGGLQSNVVLFNGLSNLASLRQAQLNEVAGEADVARAQQTVIFTVLSNYLAVIEGEEQVRVQQENLAAQEAQEEQISAYVEAGVRPISDLYQQQATTASARLSLVQARRTLELARMALIRTLQLDPREEYDFQVHRVARRRGATRWTWTTSSSRRWCAGRTSPRRGTG